MVVSSLLAPKRVDIEDIFEIDDKDATSMRVQEAATDVAIHIFKMS